MTFYLNSKNFIKFKKMKAKKIKNKKKTRRKIFIAYKINKSSMKFKSRI